MQPLEFDIAGLLVNHSKIAEATKYTMEAESWNMKR